MLRRLQLARTLEACLDGPPGHEPEGRELLSGGRRGLPRARLIGELGHDALREVSRARPFLVLVAHDGARQALQRRHRRERLHYARSAPRVRRGPRAVAHEVDGAPLPGGALEGLLDRAHEALVGVGGGEPHSPRPAP